MICYERNPGATTGKSGHNYFIFKKRWNAKVSKMSLHQKHGKRRALATLFVIFTICNISGIQVLVKIQ
jgi:hypothetical protein